MFFSRSGNDDDRRNTEHGNPGTSTQGGHEASLVMQQQVDGSSRLTSDGAWVNLSRKLSSSSQGSGSDGSFFPDDGSTCITPKMSSSSSSTSFGSLSSLVAVPWNSGGVFGKQQGSSVRTGTATSFPASPMVPQYFSTSSRKPRVSNQCNNNNDLTSFQLSMSMFSD